MPQHRRRWPTVIGSAVLAGGFFYLAMTVVYRFVLGDSWDWSQAAGSAIAMTSIYLGIGAAVRWGGSATARRRGASDQTP